MQNVWLDETVKCSNIEKKSYCNGMLRRISMIFETYRDIKFVVKDEMTTAFCANNLTIEVTDYTVSSSHISHVNQQVSDVSIFLYKKNICIINTEDNRELTILCVDDMSEIIQKYNFTPIINELLIDKK